MNCVKRVVICPVVLGLIFLAGCVRTVQQGGSVRVENVQRSTRVGLIVPLSGKYTLYGESALHGVACALGLKPPCVSSNNVELIVKDSGSDPQKAAQLVEELVNGYHVAGIIGPLLKRHVDAVVKKAQELKTPIITLSQDETIQNVGDYVFRIGLSSARQVNTIVAYSIYNKGLRRFSMIYPDDAYGNEMKPLFERAVARMGGTFVEAIRYDSTKASLYEWLTGASEQEGIQGLPKLKKADGIFIPDSYRNVNRLVSMMGAESFQGAVLLGTNRWNNRGLLEYNPKPLEGAIFADAFHAADPSPLTQSFIKNFKEAYGLEPTILEAMGYDAALLMSRAIGQRGTSPDAMKKFLQRLKRFKGVTGELAFSSDGNIIRDLIVLSVRGGRIQMAEPMDEKTKKAARQNVQLPIDNTVMPQGNAKKTTSTTDVPIENYSERNGTQPSPYNSQASKYVDDVPVNLPVPTDSLGRTKY